MTIEVADSDLRGHRQVTVTCYTTTATNGVVVTLAETAVRGLFRGAVKLGSGPAASSGVTLPAQPGDSVWVKYSDDVTGALSTSRATVDIQAPHLANLKADTGYEDAHVSWTTSEPADALVQFGESTFLGRTAYASELELNHALTLVGLQPDRLYFYQVVSRDSAGNTAVDDNQGKLYSFRTLKPVFPPWSDSFDAATPDDSWSVANGTESIASWKRGVPNTGSGSAAHSPPQAWGSNLNGDSIDIADTTLTGPALQLTGGNIATLQFWQDYDFRERSDADVQEYGQLLISTNNNLSWAKLKEYSGTSGGWMEEKVDLTPYLGQVIRLGWYYGLYSLEAKPRPGWLLDNISVTVTNLAFGGLQVSNNLAQATFTISGPLSRTGQGLAASFTNAPAGLYVIQFGDVPFFQTPPPQTNALTAGGGMLVFRGVYTFPDLNQNGISDLWEQQFFGNLAPTPAPADTDGDGFSDYAEFMAGTDPTDAQSKLALLTPEHLPNNTCRVSWTALPGRGYRLQTSGDAAHWSPLTGWLRATNHQLSYNVPLSALSKPAFFRLEVIP